MIGTAMSGEKCEHCGRTFTFGQRVNLVGRLVYCPPGSGCTQRVLAKNNVKMPAYNTGMLSQNLSLPKGN